MTIITNDQFNKQLKEQKENAIKWRELESGTIYTITNAEYINTKYDEACILTLSDDKKVFAPSVLINRLKLEYSNPFSRYVRPNGRVQSKRNLAQAYYTFDLV